MDARYQRLNTALAGAALAALAACGGGSDDAAAPAPVAAPTTTNIGTTVVDGPIRNALVCVDKNANGVCDADETQGMTDGDGKVTLAVPNGDVGKYPMLAIVDPAKGAVDTSGVALTTAYTMSAPADQTAVVSPLTTLVQQTIASTGVGTADAVKSVQNATGISASLFADFTKATAPIDGSVDPAAVARMVVITTQQQAIAIASTLGTTAIDNAKITQADLDKAIQKKLLELLPALVSALGDPAVIAATTPAAKEAALLSAATALVGSAGLTPAAVATIVAVNTQNSTPAAVTPRVATAGFTLDTLSFTDASNFYMRALGSSVAQDTPDALGKVRYVERRQRSASGNVARWGSGNDPWRNADLNWNGTAWVSCPINFENISSVRDPAGNSTYTYCDGRETGKSNRATFDIAGKTMASVYEQAKAAGYTNLFIADPSVLGTATFPADAKLFYQTNTALTEAFAYYPAGAALAPGFGNQVTQYSAAVSAGGTASAQAAGVGCNAQETSGSGTNTTSLEGLIASRTGTPCIYAQNNVSYNGATYASESPSKWWGNSTVSLGTIGGVSTTPTATSTGHYTGNTLLRVAFTGSGANAVTYYACKQRYQNGSTRECQPIGTGSYTIATLGDGRVLTLNNPPLQAAGLNYNRVFVERGGLVYFGYQSKPVVTAKVRLNSVASSALLARLGLTAEDPAAALALSAGSYQGTWDLRNTGTAVSANNGTTLFVNANGSSSCQDRVTSAFEACTVTITNPATGAFTLTDPNGSGNSASGSFNFAVGTASGTFIEPASTPPTGSFVGGRR